MFCVKKSRTFGRICAGCFAGKSCTGFMQENHILHVGKLQGFSCHRAYSGSHRPRSNILTMAVFKTSGIHLSVVLGGSQDGP